MSAVKKTKGLGRGLDALLGPTPGEAQREAERAAPAPAAPPLPRERARLPIEFLAPDPDQPRRHFNDDAIDELALSIRARGLLQPILVRPIGENSYRIVAGERRWRAAQKAGLHDVPVIIRELTDSEAAEIALIENVQRVDLNPVEEARAYRRLAETHGRTQDEIARAVGKSRSHVANIMRLLSLPAGALGALERGDISIGHARAIIVTPEPDAVCEVVLRNALSVRQTERLVGLVLKRGEARASGDAPEGGGSAGSGPARSAPGKPAPERKDADTRALEASLAEALGLEVEVAHAKGGSGAVTIRYRDIDQLDEIVRRLMGQAV